MEGEREGGSPEGGRAGGGGLAHPLPRPFRSVVKKQGVMIARSGSNGVPGMMHAERSGACMMPGISFMFVYFPIQ